MSKSTIKKIILIVAIIIGCIGIATLIFKKDIIPKQEGDISTSQAQQNTENTYKNNDSTTQEYYDERKEIAEEQNKNTTWFGSFPINKSYVETTGLTGVLKFEDQALNIISNEEIKEYKKDKNMQEYYSTSGYTMFLPKLTKTLSNVKQTCFFYKITNGDKGSICEYIIVAKYENSNDVIILKQQSDNSNATISDFTAFEKIWNNLFNFEANQYPLTMFKDFDNTNNFITDNEIYTLCNNHYTLVNNVFCNSNLMPINTIDQDYGLEQGKEAVDIVFNDTLFKSFLEYETFVKELWNSDVAYRLTYTNNGYSNIYEKLEDGGVSITEVKEMVNPYYLQENNIFYRGAYLEKGNYGEQNTYKVEVIDVNNDYCLFKKWYRNASYGILSEENHEKEFLYSTAILKKYEDTWKFERIFTDIEINSISEYESLFANKDSSISLEDAGFSYYF